MSEIREDKIPVLEQRVKHLSSLVEKHESQIERLTEQVNMLSQASTRTEVYVGQIFNTLEDIKTQLRFLQEKGEKIKDRESSRWIDFFKQIAFLLIGAAVTYLFTISR